MQNHVGALYGITFARYLLGHQTTSLVIMTAGDSRPQFLHLLTQRIGLDATIFESPYSLNIL